MANQFLIKNTMADMRNLSASEITSLQGTNPTYAGVELLGYYEKGDTPAPIVYYLNTTADPDDGGSVIETNVIKLVHNYIGHIHVSYFGLKSNSFDDQTNILNNISSYLSDKFILDFHLGAKYYGNLIIKAKGGMLNFNNSEFIPTNDLQGVIRISGVKLPIINVVGNPSFGQTSFTVSDASSLKVKQLIQLEDKAERPDGLKSMNKELLKIKSIVGNVVTVYDIVRGIFNTGQVFITPIESIANVEIKDLKITSTTTHTFPLLLVENAERVKVDNILCINFYGNACRLDSVYEGCTNNIFMEYPRAVSSGEGYGLAINESRHISSNNIYGNGTRHVVDYKCSYRCEVSNVYEPNGQSSCVALAHNGFGGFITVNNVQTSGNSYAVSVSNQGFNEENKSVQVFRGYKINNVDHIWLGRDINTYNAAIRFNGGDYADIKITNITANFDDSTNFSTLNSKSNVVHIEGNKKGNIEVENISSRVIGVLIRDDIRSVTSTVSGFKSSFKNLFAHRCFGLYKTSGNLNMSFDGLNSFTLEGHVLQLDRSGSQNPNYIEISDKGLSQTLRQSTSKLIVSTTGLSSIIKGTVPVITAGSGSAIIPVMDGIISVNRLYNSNGFLRIIPTSTVTLNSVTPFEASLFEGHEVLVSIGLANEPTQIYTVIIPGGSSSVANMNDLVLEFGKTYKFIFYYGKWRLIG